MHGDRSAHQLERFLFCGAGCDATRQIRQVGAEVALAPLNNNEVIGYFDRLRADRDAVRFVAVFAATFS